MNPRVVLLAFTACGGAGQSGTPATTTEITHRGASGLAEDDVYRPPYSSSELQQALAAERAAVTAAEQRVHELEDKGDYDVLRIARDDLAVRRSFVASLETCAATGRVCPPRLDDPAWAFDIESNRDPKLDAALRFDVASWQKVSAELHGRACACRTRACVDSMFVAIERLETRPMPDVQSDDDASLSITRARDCLYRLRGLRPTPRAVALDPS